MGIFEEACLLSCENWVASFPDEIPKHKFSKEHNKKIKNLVNLPLDEHNLSKKTIRLLLIAAVLLIGAITVFANPSSKEFVLTKFFNHSEYNVINDEEIKNVDKINVGYIPDGFIKVEDYGYLIVYKNADKDVVVEKSAINASVEYDTEKYDDEVIVINGIDAVYYRGDNNYKGIIFNNGNYIFMIDGNIEKEELVKIAQNLE